MTSIVKLPLKYFVENRSWKEPWKKKSKKANKSLEKTYLRSTIDQNTLNGRHRCYPKRGIEHIF